jgi:signal transduction histidine kinase
VTAVDDTFRGQLDSLYEMSVDVAAQRNLDSIYDRALTYCLELTASAMGFIDLVNEPPVDMDVVAIKGFEPSDPAFFERFKTMPIRPSVFGIVITDERSHISNGVSDDPLSAGTPPGHPLLHTFLGVPLRVGAVVIGMIGVANKHGGYDADDDRLLSTFANQVAVAIDNGKSYERQREMIQRLQLLNSRLSDAERDQLLSLERERIATGLHDRIEQDIFTIGLQLGSLLERDDLDPELAHRLREIRKLAGHSADEVRDVIFALASRDGSGGGLTQAVRRLLSDVERTSALETDLVVTGAPADGMAHVQDTLVAVVKEALNNVVKHARARMVLVSIRYEPDHVDVVVQDDGVGIPDLAMTTDERSVLHYGLQNMRQKITGLGGTLEIENGDERGLTIRASVPLPAAEATEPTASTESTA